MSKHTPGPWEYEDAGAQIFAEDGQRHIADVRGYGALSTAMGDAAACAQMDADGRLIAAAPDLLEACKKSLSALEGVVRICELHDSKLPEPLIDLVRDAIAKAEGARIPTRTSPAEDA